MTKIYVIIPLLMTLAFFFYYYGFDKEFKEREAQRQEAEAIAKAEETARKKALEDQAAAEAKKKSDERKAAEEAKEAEKRRKQKEADDAVRMAFEEATKQADVVNSKKNDLENTLRDVRKNKENLQKQSLQLAKEVEMLEIQRRNAEIELQRVTEMMANRVGGSALVQAPLFLNPAEKPKSK